MEIPSEALFAGLVLLLLVAVTSLRPIRSKGQSGERRVRAAIRRGLPRNTYHSLHDLTLPTWDGTTQVDHVVVSTFGVFVIETKNLTGWIFGDEISRKWSQSIYAERYQFRNPLHQNYKHVKAVEELLGFGPECLHSVVAFAGDSEFKTIMPPNVLERAELARYIRSKTDILLTEQQVDDAVRKLKKSRISGFGTRRRHIRNLRENQRNRVCPRCGKPMVLRTARRGPNAGSQFWGCSGYPQCRATRETT